MNKSNSLIKRAAFIIAFREFKDEEYFKPRVVLENRGVSVETFSNKDGMAIGAEGREVIVKKLDDLNVSDFDAVVFIGGPGALDNLDNKKSYILAQEAIAQDKILGAICISPLILAKAGVLKGKKATVWTSALNKKPERTLKENSAIFIDEDVVVDGDIITANGPSAAEKFGEKILDSLK